MRRKLFPVAGAVQLRSTGRPAIVVGQRCSPEYLAHEVWKTEAEILLGVECEREVALGKAVADMTFTRDGDLYAVEVDNAHKQSRAQYAEKWKNYGKFEGFILVLCHTDKRMRSLVKWAEPQKEVCLFNTFARLAAGEPWTDWSGATAEV